mmetsp:Transcript_4059/g.9146  ORF Transcript_4059/g.9146 Transcript_4059/m.9146 type:complete len:238 (-) Transcript_4059:78-791(-)
MPADKSKTSGSEAAMPVGSPKRRVRRSRPKQATDSLDSLAETTTSWSDLELLKGRTASVMDRVEYLASTSNLFTDFRAAEAKDLNNSLRHTTQGGGRQNLALSERISKSKSAASLVLEGQKERLLKGGTIVRRADALTRYIVSSETLKHGKQSSQAAKTSAKGTTFRMMRPYPMYDELYEFEQRIPGEPRESPMMAVSIRMPYTLSEKARLHGSPKPDKTKSKSNSDDESEADEDED